MLLSSYRRRAFLLLTIAALEPSTASAASAGETLWDVLVRPTTSTKSVTPTTASVPRRSLGPVPGFSLPASQDAETDQIFTKKKRRQPGFLGDVSEWWGRMRASNLINIKPSGQSVLRFQTESISGNAEAYRDSQYLGQGGNGVYADTRLSLDATFLKHFHYKTTITNSPFQNPNENRVQLDYNTKNTRFEWGDIQAGFQGNSLIDFSRFLRGIKVTNTWNNQLRTSLLYSQTRAETKTVSIPGNNSSGPYYVYAGFIVEGTDQVRVDNQEMVRGRDYTLNLDNGELRFTNGKVILQSQSIAVSFETMGFNQQKGNIYGFRGDYSLKGGTRFGMTYVMQQAKGSNQPVQRTQQFYGQTDPSIPYVLDASIDLTKPLLVTIAGIPLVRGVDYDIDTNLTNQLRLRQPIPSTNIVQVQYFPLSTTPIPGDRNVLGIDTSFRLGKLGGVTLEGALSGLNLSGVNTSGRAVQLTADLTPFRNVRSMLRVKDVNPTFSSVQSPGFNRNERSIELNNDFTLSRRLNLNVNWMKAWRPSYGSGLGTTLYTPVVAGRDAYDQYSVGLNYDFAKNGNIRLSRNSLGTRFYQGGNTGSINDDLALNYTLGAVSMQAGLSHTKSGTNSYYVSTGTSGAQLYDTASSTISERFALNWKASRQIDLRGTFSNNDIRNTGTTFNQSTARDMQFSLRYTPDPKITLSYSYGLSDTGSFNGTGSNTTTTGTTGTTTTGTTIGTATRLALLTRQAISTGGGLNSGLSGSISSFSNSTSTLSGGGINSGLGNTGNYGGYLDSSLNSGYGVSSFGGRSVSNGFSVDWTPRHSVVVGFGIDQSKSLGDMLYNSDRSNFRFHVSYLPSERFALTARVDTSKVNFTSGAGGTTTSMFTLGFEAQRIIGKMNARLNWTSARTGGGTNFSALSTGTGTGTSTGTTSSISLVDTSTNTSSFWGRLDYPLAARQTLFLEFNGGSSTGFLASRDTDLRIGMEYTLTREFNLALGWQMQSRSNQDATNSAYNYKINSLLAELRLNF